VAVAAVWVTLSGHFVIAWCPRHSNERIRRCYNSTYFSSLVLIGIDYSTELNCPNNTHDDSRFTRRDTAHFVIIDHPRSSKASKSATPTIAYGRYCCPKSPAPPEPEREVQNWPILHIHLTSPSTRSAHENSAGCYLSFIPPSGKAHWFSHSPPQPTSTLVVAAPYRRERNVEE